MQMDEVTQQNAALVEEASAAARAMQEQANELQRQMTFFRLGEPATAASVSAAPRPRAATAPRRTVAAATPVRAATSTAGAWTEF
jgi:methyl-accepting chemotaxis protein